MLALAVLGYAAFEFTGVVTSHAASAAPKPAGSPHKVTTVPLAGPTAKATASAAGTASVPPSATATAAPQARTMTPVSAVAFGPNGTADGDDPQNAARVLTDPAAGWVSQWYATPYFGDLKQGTGLLLDMGRTITITTVGLTLGSPPGAQLQLRLGTAPNLSTLPVVKTVAATGDQLSVPLTVPVRARYVLLWFTKLPPDGSGTYQAFVHQVTVQGHP